MVSGLYVHIVWTTRDRQPLITPAVADFLRHFLPAVARQESCEILELGIVSDHLHILAFLHPTTYVPRLLQRLKGGAAVVAWKEGVTPWAALKWARGYSIHSVSRRNLDAVRDYVRSQPARHPDRAIAA